MQFGSQDGQGGRLWKEAELGIVHYILQSLWEEPFD